MHISDRIDSSVIRNIFGQPVSNVFLRKGRKTLIYSCLLSRGTTEGDLINLEEAFISFFTTFPDSKVSQNVILEFEHHGLFEVYITPIIDIKGGSYLSFKEGVK